jgi:hypothetical protein
MSASAYINRARILAEARNRKVQYPGNVASLNTLVNAINCRQDFTILNYTVPPKCYSLVYNADLCKPILEQPTCCCPSGTLNGGSVSTEATDILYGGGVTSNYSTVLNGGSP